MAQKECRLPLCCGPGLEVPLSARSNSGATRQTGLPSLSGRSSASAKTQHEQRRQQSRRQRLAGVAASFNVGSPANVTPRSVNQAVVEVFAGAMKGSTVMLRLMSVVKAYGLNKSNTIYGQSICSDEINSDPGHISTLLTQYFGRAFPLGGISGAPFAGKTGFKAFSHHVPDNGHVLVLFGPHIGFSPDGEPGKFLRKGQAALSTSCGAVVAAYGQLTSGDDLDTDTLDIEQSWLRMRLKEHVGAVASSKQPMVELVMRAYEEVEKAMLAISNTDYGPGNLILLGGIQINMPYPMPGYFMPLHCSVRSQTLPAKDLMLHFS